MYGIDLGPSVEVRARVWTVGRRVWDAGLAKVSLFPVPPSHPYTINYLTVVKCVLIQPQGILRVD